MPKESHQLTGRHQTYRRGAEILRAYALHPKAGGTQNQNRIVRADTMIENNYEVAHRRITTIEV